MIFDLRRGIETDSLPINKRLAVRCICVSDGKLLMIETNKGDVKLPGGGVGADEDIKRALIREVKEETGCDCKVISDCIGRVIERRVDRYEKDKLFEMESVYYFCEVIDSSGKQRLDDYEAELGFQPIWIEPSKAIVKNKEYLKNKNNTDLWTSRENDVLENIQSNLTNMTKNIWR